MKRIMQLAVISGIAVFPTFGGAANTDEVSFGVPSFAKSCVSSCEDCGNDSLQWTVVAERYNSLLPGYQVCFAVQGRCDDNDDCERTGEGTAAANPVPMEEVWLAVRQGSVATLDRLIDEYPDAISVNRDRASLQIVDCSGRLIGTNLPLPQQIVAELTD